MTMVHIQHNSGNQEWYTPEWIIEAARLTMGRIDLDPASNPIANEWIRATQYFTQEQNGLLQSWSGCVWLNPPYANKLMNAFIEKLEQSRPAIDAACVLTNNATETQWGQQLLRISSAVCFLAKRVKFLTPDVATKQTGLQGQMVCYLGIDPTSFTANFNPYGRVFVRGILER